MPTLSQSDIHEQLQRFQARFSSWLGDALEPLETDRNSRVRRAALDLQLRLSSAALDIAIGPNPDAGLLDMVTMIELARMTVAGHWIPKVFGNRQAGPLAEVMQRSCDDVWTLARQVLSPPEEAQLRRLIEQCQVNNPEQLHVGGMRLSAFASPAAAGLPGMNHEATGLFAGVKKAVKSADEGRLLAERGLYAVQRLPFLMRIQARLAGQQMLNDVQTSLGPSLTVARHMLRSALLASAAVGVFLLLYRLARR